MHSLVVEEKIHKTFDAQGPERKKTIKKIIMKQIWIAVNVDKLRASCNADMINNVCKNSVDDLPIDELSSGNQVSVREIMSFNFWLVKSELIWVENYYRQLKTNCKQAEKCCHSCFG